jgi:hypothetical protein
MSAARIVTLEAALRAALAAHDRSGAAANLKALDEAADRYDLACNDLKQCQQIGCRNTSAEWAHCEAHRG